MAVLAIAEQGNLLNAPDVYMDKLAVGPGYPDGVIDLAKSPSDNVRAVAAAKGVAPDEIIVCVLDRPRHAELIAELRGLGCGIQLIPDGDVAGVIAVTDPDTTIDIYMGSGGAPEGVLAAAALRCVGGQFQGRLLFRNDAERARAAKWGVEDLNRIYQLEDLAKGDCIFAATVASGGPGGAVSGRWRAHQASTASNRGSREGIEFGRPHGRPGSLKCRYLPPLLGDSGNRSPPRTNQRVTAMVGVRGYGV